MNLPPEQGRVRICIRASNQPDEGSGAILAGPKQWRMPDEIQENVTRAKQLARNRFQRRYTSLCEISPPLILISHLAFVLCDARVVTRPFLGANFRVYMSDS